MILAAFLLGIIVGAVLVVGISCMIVSEDEKRKDTELKHMLRIYDDEEE